MACYSPITGYRRPDGKVTFVQKEGYYDRPVTIACGQCLGCRLERSRQWAVRCMHEAQMHESNSFITLTYSDTYLPSDGSLILKHWQDFAKRLRKTAGPFRFYHCGEYGPQTWRPHYHALLFGLDFSQDRLLYKHTPRGDRLYQSELLDATWKLGATYIGALTLESASYVARYCMKKQTGEKAKAHYERVDVATGEVFNLKPEYATMSRRPGIGASWLKKYQTDVFPRDFVVSSGHKTRPPRFYDYMLDSEDPAMLAEIKTSRVRTGRKHRANNSYERLRVREKVKLAQISHLARSTH